MSVAGLEVLFECKDAASLSAKRQLGQKTAATSRPCACLIACREGCAALTDGWGGAGVRRIDDAGCVRYTVNSSLGPITLIHTLVCQAAGNQAPFLVI